jgi:hypothetical protein
MTQVCNPPFDKLPETAHGAGRAGSLRKRIDKSLPLVKGGQEGLLSKGDLTVHYHRLFHKNNT